ncbi:TPA: carboxypeptidase [Patescibacteria group bacterium]|nr:MAG: carboxypeptidase [Parcubacteria group bacterium GW2011_GWD2_42_14]HCC05334.1 carboxypeptidase [Patescibacteria group bacterium]
MKTERTGKMYEELVALCAQAGEVGSSIESIGWDQHVMMPRGAKSVEVRGRESSALSALHHGLITTPRIGELLQSIDVAKLSEAEAAQVREIKEMYKRAVGVPTELVAQITKLATEAEMVWRNARSSNDFALFQPYLEQLVALKCEEARCIDPRRRPYEVLLQEYEPGMTLGKLDKFFASIRSVCVPLIQEIANRPQPDVSMLNKEVPMELQVAYNKMLAALLGYDFENGRLDTSTHPMTCGFGRVTNRYTNGWLSALLGTAHEVGHGNYCHNLPLEHYGTPLGTYRSLGVHESQSLMMERHIAKSYPFWRGHFRYLQAMFSPALNGVTAEQFYHVVNLVEPGFIRVEADELTYTMHIILRYEIEKALMDGSLEVKDLPLVWNGKMKDLLGIVPPNDTLGCLQDIHWTDGSFGYFPTYTLGAIGAAQLFAGAEAQVPTLERDVAEGDLSSLNIWLKKNVHQHGCRYRSDELYRLATGSELTVGPYLAYLTEKFTNLYKL